MCIKKLIIKYTQHDVITKWIRMAIIPLMLSNLESIRIMNIVLIIYMKQVSNTNTFLGWLQMWIYISQLDKNSCNDVVSLIIENAVECYLSDLQWLVCVNFGCRRIWRSQSIVPTLVGMCVCTNRILAQKLWVGTIFEM